MHDDPKPSWLIRCGRMAVIGVVMVSVLGLAIRFIAPALIEDESTSNLVGVCLWSLAQGVGWLRSKRSLFS
ncbi:MAG: hypothetical protein JSS02_08270 [Planctomycetes bacterium]|nr:hypothetical protein [Planctomycetota bacterium]